VDPSENITEVARQVELACIGNNIACWPESPNSHTFINGNTLYIMYVKPAGEVTASIGIIAIIAIILFIAPIIMYFAIPGVSELINGIISIAIMMMMMKLMMPMFESMSSGTKPRAVKAAPAEQKPPFEQRVSRRIESIADSIVRTESAFERSKEAGVSAVSSVVNDITRLVNAIKGAPSTSMTSYQKAKAIREVDTLDDKLEKYRNSLSPTQQGKFDEQQSIVDELRAMYD